MERSSNQIPVLEVRGLTLSFRQYDVGLRQQEINVLRDLYLSIYRGEIVAVVGSSGSGKSLLAHAILGILPNNAFLSGDMLYNGEKITQKKFKNLRGKEIMLVPQSVNYLDPLMKVGDQLRTAIFEKITARDKENLIDQLLEKYFLDPAVKEQYPFQLSGGMARRILICCAVLSGAKLIVADEPTPGLHPLAVKEILNHLRQLADDGCAVMLITHDIDISMQIADRIAVFYSGTTLEIANTNEFDGDGEGLRHPYSKALFYALPQNGFKPLDGFQPSFYDRKQGCSFAARCQLYTPECQKSLIEMRSVRNGQVRCINAS